MNEGRNDTSKFPEAVDRARQNNAQKRKIMESFSPHRSVRSSVGFVSALAVVIGLCVGVGLRAQVVVAPNVAATNDANTFLTAAAGPAVLHVMQMVDASQFGALSGPSWLTQIAHRPENAPGFLGPRTATLKIYVSTTRRTVAGMSTTFSENIGTNNTLVFDGTVSLSTQNLPGPNNTRQFDIVYPFTNPFLYDPAAGNLLVEFQTSTGSGQSLRWDAVNGDPSVRTLVGAGSPTAPTGSFNASEVRQFTFVAPALATIRSSQVEICWNSLTNLTYQVQYRSELTTNLWTSLVDCVRGLPSVTCLTDSILPGQPQRFYRVISTNCVVP